MLRRVYTKYYTHYSPLAKKYEDDEDQENDQVEEDERNLGEQVLSNHPRTRYLNTELSVIRKSSLNNRIN